MSNLYVEYTLIKEADYKIQKKHLQYFEKLFILVEIMLQNYIISCSCLLLMNSRLAEECTFRDQYIERA